MCGIFSILNNIYSDDIVKKNFYKSSGRGPENSQIINVNNNVFGFHRLGINGYNDVSSNQPFNIDGIYLICNGEIYNWKQLYKMMDIKPTTKSDCEIIIHMYKKFGIEQTLNMLDGVFAFLLYDTNKEQIFVSRDVYGVRPLFIKKVMSYSSHHYIREPVYLFASELKSICDFSKSNNTDVEQFEPGSYMTFNRRTFGEVGSVFVNKQKFYKPSIIPKSFHTEFNEKDVENAISSIHTSLTNAVLKRIDNTDRDIACLLSGGLDSSLIAALVQKNSNKQISTWSIGMPGSEDIKYAKLVAEHIGSDHHEIILSEKEFLSSIEEVIYSIESYDTTTVRASIGNWLISKMIKENSDCKVVFNGDGSDEVCGGYMYFHLAPNSIDFDKESKKLLNNIHFFDVLRSDRSISVHGLEARTPFLDRNFVDTYLSINPNIRHHAKNKQCEKYLLRKAFDKDNLLPSKVLWRTKEAFSDGVSSLEKSWFTVLQEHIDINVFKNNYIVDSQKKHYTHNKPETNEQLYYRNVFDSRFKGCEKVIPYFWMPNFTDAKDASARTLDIYKQNIKEN
jgi:asparagine synthase (glutamine-hydrolysing)